MATTIPNISVSSTSNAGVSKPKTTNVSIFYINDVHSNLNNLAKLKSASDQFDEFIPSTPTDKLKFSAGDIGVGRDPAFNSLAVDFQNITNIMASAAGNHELDLNKDQLAAVLKNSKYKFMGMNVDIPQTSVENKELSKDIIKSYIQEQNGNKYGVIGLMPFDLALHLSDGQEYKDFNILSIEKTVPLLQKEVDKMKEQGVNKIIVLSHSGFDSDQKIAQSVDGIDVIIGGHTHDLVKGITEGKNLFYSKKTGEPTIITQAGKNGDYFGVLNLEFDQNGIVKTAQNDVTPTESYPRNMVMNYFIDKVLGKPVTVGTVKSAPRHKHNLISENPSADFVLDAEKSELGVDIVLINSGNFRSSFEPGKLTDRDLKVLTPFDNKVWVLQLTEKDIIDALKIGAKSMIKIDNTPGLIQCSGLKYTVSKTGELKSASFIDKNGNNFPIDVNNPNPFKTYSVSTDDYIAKGGNNYFANKSDSATAKYDFDKNKLVEDYFKHHPEPAVVKADGRITIVD